MKKKVDNIVTTFDIIFIIPVIWIYPKPNAVIPLPKLLTPALDSTWQLISFTYRRATTYEKIKPRSILPRKAV